MRQKYAIVFFLIFYSINCFSQDSNSVLSKLRLQYKQSKEDTARINVLFKMGYHYIDGPSDSLLFYFREAQEIINTNLQEYLKDELTNKEMIEIYRYYKIRALIEFGIENFFQSDYPKALNYYFEALEEAKMYDIELESECYSEIGIVYKNQGDYDKALHYYNLALEKAKLTTDTSWVASCQVNIGNVYKVKGYLIIAQKYFLDALKILEKLGHDRRVSSCYQNIGDIYHKQLDYNIALEYYSRALVLAKKDNHIVSEFTSYLNIGYIYVNMEQYFTARNFLIKAIGLYEKTGYQHELDNAFILLGDTYFYKDDFNQATDYYNKALNVSSRENDKTTLAEIRGRLGKTFMKKGNYEKARSYFEKSLSEADSVGSMVLKMEANSNLSQYYEVIGDFSKALHYHKKYNNIKDSLFSAEKYKSIMEMEVKYKTEKQEQEMVLLSERNKVQKLKLNRRNRLYYTSLIGISLLLMVAYVLIRNRQLRAIHKSIELEQKLMRSQMNPHFIFNSLIAIQSYIYKQEAIKAGDYLARFAELIRITLENSREEFVLLEKEIKMLNAYLELQNLRFEDKFDYNIDLKEDINSSVVQIPPMMAQPFIENAIEHGLRHRDTKGFVEIVFELEEKGVICTVKDNGIGREKAMELNTKKNHKSMATSITKDRLKILSKKERNKYTLKITDLFDDKANSIGTTVVFNMPFRKGIEDA